MGRVEGVRDEAYSWGCMEHAELRSIPPIELLSPFALALVILSRRDLAKENLPRRGAQTSWSEGCGKQERNKVRGSV